jgi:hypothetical protein
VWMQPPRLSQAARTNQKSGSDVPGGNDSTLSDTVGGRYIRLAQCPLHATPPPEAPRRPCEFGAQRELGRSGHCIWVSCDTSGSDCSQIARLDVSCVHARFASWSCSVASNRKAPACLRLLQRSVNATREGGAPLRNATSVFSGVVECRCHTCRLASAPSRREL